MTTPAPAATCDRGAAPRPRLGGHFYLASALCMLVGYYVLADAIPDLDGRLAGLTAMVSALEVYEFVLVGLGLYLLVRRRAARDGAILIVLALLFVLDATFLNVEVLTADGYRGLPILAMSFALAVAKGWLVLRVLGLRLPAARIAVLLCEMAAILGLPAFSAYLNEVGELTPRTLHLLWWSAGLLFAAKGIVRALTPERLESAAGRGDGRGLLRGTFEWAPGASLIVHLAAISFIFDEPFLPAFAAPVVLGFAVLVLVSRPGILEESAQVAVAHLFPLFAILLCVSVPARLEYEAFGGGVAISPFRLALTGAAIVWSLAGLRLRRRYLHGGSLAAVALAFSGPGPQEAWKTLSLLVPNTQFKWGVAAVGAAFALLGVGALFSLRRGPGRPVTARSRDRSEGAEGPEGFRIGAPVACTAAVVLILATVAIPNVVITSRGGGGNETAAIATLRNIYSAQCQFQAARAVDLDADGRGEFGTFLELSGAGLLRGGVEPIDPPVLSGAFRGLSAAGAVSRSGYFFRIYLPDARGRPVHEIAGAGKSGSVLDSVDPVRMTGDADPDRAELQFCVYAWPVRYGRSGDRSFVLTSDGGVYSVEDHRYDGRAAPSQGAAFSNASDGDWSVPDDGTPSWDGNTWRRVN